jgi:hypothetical protein
VTPWNGERRDRTALPESSNGAAPIEQHTGDKKNNLGVVVRSMKSDSWWWSLGALVLSSCFEQPDPPWLLDESREIIAVRAEVILDGPEADGIVPVPADRFRAEALPGDELRARLIAASRSGVEPDEDVDAAWYMCRDRRCLEKLRNDPMSTPCGAPLAAGDGCSLGRSADALFRMPPLVPDAVSGYPLPDVTLGVVLGRVDGPTTSECVGRLLQRPYVELEGCTLFDHIVYGGPLWKIAELSGVSDEQSDAFRFVPANANPEVERFDVTIRSEDGSRRDLVVSSGERVPVSGGESVSFGVQVDPRDAQSYVLGYRGEISTMTETLAHDYLADVAVSTSTEYWNEPRISWTVPIDEPQVSFIATLVDPRGGVGWGTIAFDVGDAVP